MAVNNDFGLTVYSDWATLMIQSPPVITQRPQPVVGPSDTNVALTVAVSGTGPFSYQWRRNGIPLPGQTNPTLQLTNVQISDSGDYSALVSNAAGWTASAVANLEVFRRVRILTHPVSRTANTNTPVSFTVAAEGTGSLRYQWKYFGQDLPGETNATLTLPAVRLDQSGDYTAVLPKTSWLQKRGETRTQSPHNSLRPSRQRESQSSRRSPCSHRMESPRP